MMDCHFELCAERLREKAAGRLNLIAGGGLTLEALPEIAQRTGVSYLHGSLTQKRLIGGAADCFDQWAKLEADVREAVRLFRSIVATRSNSAPAIAIARASGNGSGWKNQRRKACFTQRI